jgi:hypothetical protein
MIRGVSLAAATLFTVVCLAACGGSSAGLLAPVNVTTLNADLNRISVALENQDCTGATAALTSLNQDISALPTSTNQALLNQLIEGEDSLSVTVPKQCQSSTGLTGATGTSGTSGPSGNSGTSGTSSSTTTSSTTTSTSSTSTTCVGPGGGIEPCPTGNSGSSGSSNGGSGI